MEEDYKRKLSELKALYSLEPNAKDIYTEGNEDTTIIKLLFEREKILNVKVIPISQINFLEAEEELKSNKEKIKYLSKILDEKYDDQLEGVTCIVDRDFDGIENSLMNNSYLHYTDYANLEMYLYDVELLNKFLQIGIKNFPLSGKQVLNEITPTLIDLFAIRFARSKKHSEFQLLQLDKNIKWKNNSLVFDKEEYLKKFLTKNKAINKLNFFQNEMKVVYTKYEENDDPKFFIHGKDFFSILFLLIKKIKNTYSFKEQTFNRTLFVNIEFDLLKKEKLFADLVRKYKNFSA